MLRAQRRWLAFIRWSSEASWLLMRPQLEQNARSYIFMCTCCIDAAPRAIDIFGNSGFDPLAIYSSTSCATRGILCTLSLCPQGADGEPVGIGASPFFILDSDNISVSSETRSGVYQDGLPANEVTESTQQTTHRSTCMCEAETVVEHVCIRMQRIYTQILYDVRRGAQEDTPQRLKIRSSVHMNMRCSFTLALAVAVICNRKRKGTEPAVFCFV